MNVVSVCPLKVDSLDWQTSRGRTVMTVIAKATYRLAPVTSPLADDQEEPSEYEVHHDYDPGKSVRAPSDLIPFKPRPEVTLVGHAFAPRGEPVARLVTRLIVGSVDKSIAVCADRSFGQDGALRQGPRFTRMALRWEKAAGGPETKNPVGVTGSTDTLGAMALPNLEPPDTEVTRPDDFIEPVGFGPIAAAWPARRARISRHAESWSASALRGGQLPEGLDAVYFLSAPPDQILDELRPNERIILENLHPDHPRLVTSLPGIEPRAFVERPGSNVADLQMICDTLWIDTDRAIGTLTWRGQVTLAHPAQEGRVVVAMETLGRPLAWSTVEALAAKKKRPAPGAEDTQQWSRAALVRQRTATVDVGKAVAQRWPSWLGSSEGAPAPPGEGPKPLAFGMQLAIHPPPAPPTPGDVRLDDLPGGGTGTLDTPVPKDVIEGAVARAEAARARPALPAPPVTPIPRPSLPDAAAPSWLRAPTPAPSTAKGSDDPRPSPLPRTPWAPVAKEPAATSYPTSAPSPAPVSVPAPLRPSSSPPPAPRAFRPADPSAPARSPSKAELHQATERGAAAASNAAAAASTAVPAARPRGEAPAPAAREPAREHVDLIWFDAAALPRILADKALGEGRAERPEPRWVKDAGAPREPQEIKDRREVLAIVSRGGPCDDPASLDRAASAAYKDDGSFTPPLLLVAGELTPVFDDLEILRATLVVTSPFRSADKKLREVSESAVEALKAEGRLPGDIAAGLTRRLEEAFAQGQRAVAPGYLDSSVERALLDDRRYARKTVFGEPRLRALLAFPGGGPPVPTYLPEALAPRLPLFRRFKARALVELRPQEDQYETHADALLVLALGRVVRRAGAAPSA